MCCPSGRGTARRLALLVMAMFIAPDRSRSERERPSPRPRCFQSPTQPGSSRSDRSLPFVYSRSR